MELPPPLIMGWRVRLWVQDPQGASVTYLSKKDIKIRC
jgi:hypothetical protein